MPAFNFFTYVSTLFLGCFLASVYLVPRVKRIVQAKQLMDEPNSRSSHKKSTPSLGGIAFFIILVFGFYFNSPLDEFDVAISILPGATLVFFLGLKDDLVALSPRLKFIGQIIACAFVLYHYKFSIESFHGFFGIFQLPLWVSVPLALLIMLTIINAYNLVDGIDGLAASISTIAFTCFAIVFFLADRYFLALTAVTMIGALCGFLFFNLSEKRKIFMGDTGSMLLGFLIAVFSIRLLALDQGLNELPFNPKYIPLLMGTIIFIPLYDTLRVFSIRILQGRSPLSPDRNHIHHVIIDKLKWSHRRTSFAISVFGALIVVFSVFLIFCGLNLKSLVVIFLALTGLITLVLHLWRKSLIVNA